MPPCTEPKLTTAGCFEMLLRRLTTVCAVPTRSAAATIGSTPPHGAEPCVWRPWTSMVNLSDAAISGPPRTAIRPACTDENTCRPNIASGLKTANRPSSSRRDEQRSSPEGAPSSEGWNTSRNAPGGGTGGPTGERARREGSQSGGRKSDGKKEREEGEKRK